MTAILALIGPKLLSYFAVVLAAVLGVIGAMGLARRSGVKAEQTAELKREVADSRTATEIAATTARESGDQARADLDKGFSQKSFLLVLSVGFCGISAISGCSSAGGSSRECSFARPLVFSHHSIAGLDDADARALLGYNRTAQAVCR